MSVPREDVRRDRTGASRAAPRRITRALHQAMAVIAAANSDTHSGLTVSRGDFNGDGYVSRSDFVILARNFGRQSDVTFADGDLNGDGVVDLNDAVGVVFGPGNFGLTSPQSTAQSPVISWSQAAGAVVYEITVESVPGCQGSHVVYQSTQFNNSSLTILGLPNGAYFACVKASDQAGHTISASNSSWRFEVRPVGSAVITATPGLLAWWDAGFGLTLDANNGVEKWIDRSGRQNDLQQSNSLNRPQFAGHYELLNQQAAVVFDQASSQFVTLANAPLAAALAGEDRPYEICVAYRRNARPEQDEVNETLFSVTDTTRLQNYIALQQSTAFGRMRDFNTRRDLSGLTSRISTRPEIVGLGAMIRCDSSSGKSLSEYAVGYSQNIDNDMRTDVLGGAVQDVGPMSPSTVSVGGLLRSNQSGFLSGAIAEIVVFDRRLSESERLPLLAYFKQKYFADIAAPADIPDLAHHWDASDLELGVGEPVDVWPDAAGVRHFVAAEGARPTLRMGPNGRTVVEFDGIDDAMLAGLGDDWSLLHDGRGFTAFVLYRVTEFDRDSLEPLLDTVNNDPASNAGFGVYYDNQTTLGRERQINVVVGAAGTTVMSSTSEKNVVRPQEWEVTAVRHEATVPSKEPDYVTFVSNQPLSGTGYGTGVHSALPANFALNLGKLAASDVFAKFQVAEILIYERTLSSYETRKVHEYLARKWNYSHTAVVAGNGQPGINGDGYHRGFPTAAYDDNGTLRIWYRRAADHGHSAGVTVEVTTTDGVNFSPERVIYAQPGYDIRVEGAATRLTQGPHAGRLIIAHNRSGPQSQLLPATVELLYSDDDGLTWNVIGVTAGDTEYNDWDGSAHTIFELNDGTLMLLYSGDKSSERRPHILKRISADGGITWSPAESIYNGTEDGVRAIEPNVIRRSDGSLFLLFRDDTNQRILTMRSTDEGKTWTVPEFAFDGWGTPRMVFDETGRLYVFYRAKIGTVNSYRMVWRYSDDEGASWLDERRFEHTGFAGMTYSYPIKDASRSISIVYGLEHNNDSDIFLRRWHIAAAGAMV
jgi:hypothetical protein